MQMETKGSQSLERTTLKSAIGMLQSTANEFEAIADLSHRTVNVLLGNEENAHDKHAGIANKKSEGTLIDQLLIINEELQSNLNIIGSNIEHIKSALH